MENKARIKCMGGSFCKHQPGECTADPDFQATLKADREREGPPANYLAVFAALRKLTFIEMVALATELRDSANADTFDYTDQYEWAKLIDGVARSYKDQAA